MRRVYAYSYQKFALRILLQSEKQFSLCHTAKTTYLSVYHIILCAYI